MPNCPICSGNEFDEYGRRQNARCVKCGALERGRLAWLTLSRLGVLDKRVRFLNVAPEPFMLAIGSKVIGDGYVAADWDPSQFSKYPIRVKQLDLCRVPLDFPSASFDVVMHNHVLEHVPCNVSQVLMRLADVLAPGGYHLFSVPIMPARYTEEDLNPELSGEERHRRFGQNDHMRLFGALDFEGFLRDANILHGMTDMAAMISEGDLANACIPTDALTTLSPHRVFVWRKPP